MLHDAAIILQITELNQLRLQRDQSGKAFTQVASVKDKRATVQPQAKTIAAVHVTLYRMKPV